MSGAASTVTVLALLRSREDQVSLREIFRHSNWNLHFVETIAKARPLIDELPADVVISDSRLPDGRWQDVMCELRRRPVEPPLLVASRLANEGIWAEVLNQGGYEVLAIPFKPREVFRSVSLAWRYWRDQLKAAPSAARSIGYRPSNDDALSPFHDVYGTPQNDLVGASTPGPRRRT